MGVRLPARGAIAAAVFVALALVAPAIAAPLSSPAPDPYPRIAFVARNDNPFDAMGVGPVAGAVGGVIAITPSTSLSLAAATVLTEFDPDIVIIAGGPAAISPDVEQEIKDLGSWAVERAQGDNRDETAREVARLIDKHGLARPAMLSTSSGQNVGDLYLGGDFQSQSVVTGDLTATGTLDVTLPADQLPRVWSQRQRNGATKYVPDGDGINQVFDLVVDIPADGGVLVIETSAAASNQSTTVGSTVGLFITLDNNAVSPIGAFYDSVVTFSEDRLSVNDVGTQLDISFSTVEARGAVPISKGIHHVYVIASMQSETYLQIPSVTATWFPTGTASPIGFVPAP